jgi:hypothetical protein
MDFDKISYIFEPLSQWGMLSYFYLMLQSTSKMHQKDYKLVFLYSYQPQ